MATEQGRFQDKGWRSLSDHYKELHELYSAWNEAVVASEERAEELKRFGFRLITNGTDNHLILIDMTSKNIPGKEAESRCDPVAGSCFACES